MIFQRKIAQEKLFFGYFFLGGFLILFIYI